MKKITKTLSILLTVLTLLTVLSSAPFNVSAIANDFLYYDDGNNTVKIYKYAGTDTDVIIPAEINGKTVVTIGRNSFSSNTNITSVKITSGITNIEKNAFKDCTSLKTIKVPSSVKTIDHDAFTNTAYLNESTADFVVVGDGLLYGYRGTEAEVAIPYGVKTICSSCQNFFGNKDDIISITLPVGVTEIQTSAFEDFKHHARISLPDTMREMGVNVFSNCTNLRYIKIPSSVSKIGVSALTSAALLDNYPKNTFLILGDGILYSYM